MNNAHAAKNNAVAEAYERRALAAEDCLRKCRDEKTKMLASIQIVLEKLEGGDQRAVPSVQAVRECIRELRRYKP